MAHLGLANAVDAAEPLFEPGGVPWQVVVDDKPHVGLVNAHAKGDGGTNHPHIVAQKLFLMFRALFGRQAGMIRFGRNAILGEVGGGLLHGFARLTIDNPAFPPARAEKFEQLIVGLAFGQHPVGEIGAVETGDVTARVAQFQMGDNVLAHPLRGGGGERHEGHAGKMIAQIGDLPVFRPEIMAPFADAMGLVNGDEPDLPALQIGDHAREHQALGRGVEQTVFPLMQAAQPPPGFLRGQRGIQERGRHPGGLERVHLVLHQGDQRRDHHRQPVPRQRRELKAQRFAAARGQQRKNIPPRQ